MIWLLLLLLTPGNGQVPKLPTQGTFSTNIVCSSKRNEIGASYTYPVEPRNQYRLFFIRRIQPNSRMILRFDSEVSLKLVEPIDAQISKFPGPTLSSNQFIITFPDKTSSLEIQVFGPASGYSIPYVLSAIFNDKELCTKPITEYFDEYINQTIPEDTTHTLPAPPLPVITSVIDESCGRRKVVHTELIIHGQPTQPGDWPWHAAILRFDESSSLRYICGGTLLSKTLVLTAAHCATIGGNPVVPNSLSIVLGKYNLYGGDIAAQERRVFEVIVHPGFDVKTLNNDIALLRLKSEAVLDDYVQPACLWHTELPTEEVFGTVVGWGFNHKDLLSSTLQQITVPIVSELTCLKSDPIFFQKKLNTNKFCAGFANGTSVCNGDSGGGLMIFVPDTPGDTDNGSGAWNIRGIVSLARSRSDAKVCDPHQYTIFTDVEKYRDWVMEYLN